MMKSDLPLTRDLVLIGGGHTHALILRKWAMKPLPGVRVTIINPGPTAPYSGMLPGFVAGHYTRDDLDIDLVQLARFAGARVVLGAVTAIDVAKRIITVPGCPPIAYDIASVDVGITSAMPNLTGFTENAIPAKPLGTFATRWNAFRVHARNPQIAVIGGGVAGAELCMAMAHSMRQNGSHKAVVKLVDRGAILKDLGVTAGRLMCEALVEQGVQIIENADVVRVDADGLTLADGSKIVSAFTTGAAGAKPHDWVAQIDVATHEGFITVDANLQTSDPHIFAVGDCAHMGFAPRPKAGVFAVRQAPVLFDNLRAVLSGGTMRPYKPQSDYLKLISLGDRTALAEKFGTARQGAILWRWKDHIDVKFMSQFRNFPAMDLPSVPLTVADGVREAVGAAPPCGGCGAKVGRQALALAREALQPTARQDIESLPGDDAAVLRTGGAMQVMTTDHLRAFTHDPVLMTRIAAVHALGDVWAMGAAPQAATISLILPRMAPELTQRTLAEIMATSDAVLRDAGAALVGGHTSVGDELTIGFTLTGLAEKPPITLAGAKPGDVLIVTKPIGSGVILAAEMRSLARGADVAMAYTMMVQPQAEASRLLAMANAMTDVTGFGLAGHLAGICEASGVAATVNLSAVPLMQGAEALTMQGIKSTLWAENRNGAGPIFGAIGAAADLLFDPQTAGGLLATIPAAIAEKTLESLKAAGYPAAIIGIIRPGAPAITVQP